MSKALVRDEDGIPLRSGDYITFTFGIPPISVFARISTTTGGLWIECLHPPDVKPKRESLHSLMKYYQVWKAHPSRVAAYLEDFSITPEAQPAPQDEPGPVDPGRRG